ncbi:MAG: Hsp20/alpha crystallin family protein [Eubacteriales bacterium]|nr:Hsp20/alpha crystallin family protein [Eubacteriales bacterium]
MANLVPFNRRNRGAAAAGFEDFYNMLDDFFSDTWVPGRSLIRDTFKVDVQETANEYLIEAELPGVNKDEVTLELNEGSLNIAIIREENIDEKDKNYIHRERRYASMSRSIYLGDIKKDGVRAKLEDGVLKVTVPRKEKALESKHIDIE